MIVGGVEYLDLPQWKVDVARRYADLLRNTGGNDPVELMTCMRSRADGQPNRLASTNIVRFTLAVAVDSQVELLAMLEEKGFLDVPSWGTGPKPVDPRSVDLPVSVVADILTLVQEGQRQVSIEEVAGWDQPTRRAVVEWAGAIHLVASDNEGVKIPPMPAVLKP
jgi:hypothetical protein